MNKKKKLFNKKIMFSLWLLVTFAGPLWIFFSGQVNLQSDYRTANRDSANIAPKPHEFADAIIQAYSARAFNWRGIFATHCWIAVKPKGALTYTVYQVVGWNAYHGLPALSITADIPDRNWYDAKPTLLLDIRGYKAEKLIPKIALAAQEYPYANSYTLWPGPNSNSFPAYLGRRVPELGLVLPADAIGKDFLTQHRFFAPVPSGTGYQFSLSGLLGITVAKKEGVEINILGLVYGVKIFPFRILLPGLSSHK